MAILSTLFNVVRERDKALPSVELIESHVNVKAPHGPIYLVKGWEERQWMRDWLAFVAPRACPVDVEDAVQQGAHHPGH